jgi:hypothetical protein
VLANNKIECGMTRFRGLGGGGNLVDPLAVAVYASLKITKQELPCGIMVGEVTQSLHCLALCPPGDRCPAAIAVEFLEVQNHGFRQSLMSIGFVGPNLWRV